MQFDSTLYYYRTRSGMEIDGIIDTPGGGVTAFEVKSRERVVPADARSLQKIAQTLTNSWKGGMVIYRGRKLYKLCEPDIWAVPSRRLFA